MAFIIRIYHDAQSSECQTGIIFSVSLGPDENLQVSERPVAVRSVKSEDNFSSYHRGGYVLLTANKSPNETKFHEVKFETTIKCNFALSAEGGGGAGEKGKFGKVLNLKYFVRAIKLR